MSRFLLRGRELTPDRDLPMATLLVDGKFIEFVAEGVFEPRNATPLIEAGDIIAPGFVDLQVNGFAGHDAASGAAAVTEISRLLPKYGVTAFMPTLISRPIPDAVRFVKEVRMARAPGAVIL